MAKAKQTQYITTEHSIEDALLQDVDIVCLNSCAHGLTLSIALARLTHNLPVRAKVVKGF